MFSRPNGPAVGILKILRRHPCMRRFRVQTVGRGECARLIIGIGQIHPVLSGHFERFQARKIANVQGEIFALCRELARHHEVLLFGQEGYSGAGPARLPLEMLGQLKAAAGRRGDVKRVLRSVAYRWRRALHRGDNRKAEQFAMALNGIALLQALNKRVAMFPIEQEDVHGVLGEKLRRLQRQIEQTERNPLYRSALRKEGKGLTEEEYDIAVTRNRLIKTFNKTLKDPVRDRSILREVLNHADDRITVFVLGTGHRRHILKLVSRHLPPGYLFAWATPPSLWWWKTTVRRTGWMLIAVFCVLAAFMYW